MPNLKSAVKRVRQDVVKRERNKAFKSQLRTAITKAENAIESGNLEEATPLVLNAQKVLARVQAKGVIHKNKAARKTSRLLKKFGKLSAASAS